MARLSTLFTHRTHWHLWIFPVILALVSLSFGQDVNWDLQNYHIYNPYAMLNDRINIDLAPAGFQTFFSPMLDIPTFLLYLSLPAPLVGLLTGLFQGLSYPLLFKITQKTLPSLNTRSIILLALAGCLTSNFLSSLGNSMGDATTAVFVLASVYFMICHLDNAGEKTASLQPLILSGFLVGISSGFKLTNAVYVIAVFLGLLLIKNRTSVNKLLLLFVFGISATAGLLIIDGYWLWKMWHTFGNPLFPQLSSIFKNDLVGDVSIIDQSWTPKSITEYLLWPFIFTLNPYRLGQQPIIEPLWVYGYILMFVSLIPLLSGKFQSWKDSRKLFLLTFVLLSYIIWMSLFSISRYTIPIEMLLPLSCYLLTILIGHRKILNVTVAVLLFSSLFSIFKGAPSWGHAKWQRQAFSVEQPVTEQAENNIFVLVGGDPVYGWIIPFLPDNIRFTQVASNFPDTPEFIRRQQNMVSAPGSHTYAIIAASPAKETPELNQKYREDAARNLTSRNWQLDITSCRQYHAYIGNKFKPYQFCKINTGK